MSKGLSDLNDALFDQLQRLNDPELTGDALETELKRSGAVTSVSKEIVANARVVLDAEKHRKEWQGPGGYNLPAMLESKG
ncbi:MAG: hypothetical protein ACTHWH_05930 [Marinobacter sp.]